MNSEIATVNIPELTVGEVIEKLSFLYSSAINKGVDLKSLPTPFLWGPPGVGKSRSMHQLAEILEEKTGKKVIVTDVSLLLFSPVDIRGLPAKSNSGDSAVWLIPEIFRMNESPDVINLLFLDELSAATPDVQKAAEQICLDRRIGEHRLPKNCIVCAAGNRVNDQSLYFKMPKALANRLMHFEIISDYNGWRGWAISHGISPIIIAFLGCNPERLFMSPSSTDNAYCTPRAWEHVSNILTTIDCDPKSAHELVAACVGIDTAIELEAFCRGTLDLPDVDEILAGRCIKLPRSHDVMYALISALTARVVNSSEDVTVDQLENIFTYVKKLPNDFVMYFAKDIIKSKDINKKLMRCQSFQQWLSRNNVSV